MGTLRRLHLAGNPDLTGTALSPIPNRQKIEAFTAFLLNVAPFIEVRPSPCLRPSAPAVADPCVHFRTAP